MQTFMPFPNFTYSCQILDTKRHGKQRAEAKQILMCLQGTGSTGWRNHPAVKMWVGYEQALSNYLRECILTWYRKGFNNSMMLPDNYPDAQMPPWFGDMKFHVSHQSNLVSKFPEYYKNMFPRVPDKMPYVWPS
jgi:hypothetical protein